MRDWRRERGIVSAFLAALLRRPRADVEIGPQLLARNAGDGLDGEHALGRYLGPRLRPARASAPATRRLSSRSHRH